jgi:cytochrome c oxidase cbb3-type subunit 4
MNPLLRQAVEAVQSGWLGGVMTVVFFVFFLGWIWWAYSPRNKDLMDEAARLPFMDGGEG